MNTLSAVKTIIPIGKKSWDQRVLSKCAAVGFVGLLAVSGSVSAHNAATLVTSMGPMLVTSEKMVDEKWISSEDAAQEYPLVELGAMDSNIGESKIAFLKRVGSVLHNFTGRTNHEACSAIMQKQEADGSTTYRVRLITNRSQVACLRVMYDEPDFSYTGETIHSHPFVRRWDKYQNPMLHANRVDQRMRGFMCGRNVSLRDETFSPGDLENGSGYLVARGKLLYHDDTTQTNTDFGEIDISAPLPYLAVGNLTFTQEYAQHTAQAVWTNPRSEALPTLSCRVEITNPTLRKDPVK